MTAEVIKNFLIQQMPTIIAFIQTVAALVAIGKKLKQINVTKDINDALKNRDAQIDELLNKHKQALQETEALRHEVKNLTYALKKVEYRNNDRYNKKV